MRKILATTEGLTRLCIPKNYLNKKHFFNPKTELSRDLTVLVLNTLNPKDWVVCDALAGIGVRGIRMAKECPVKEVWVNDISSDSVPFIKMNAKLNSVVKKIKITNKDANQLLSENIRKFDYIDIDPFGSPTYFFDSCARAIKRNGYIGFSATDTTALCGTSPTTCLRRYGIESCKTDFFKELGIRILIANAAFSFSKWSFSLKPLISFASEHYFRVFAEVKKGKSIANKTLKENLGYVSYCSKCLWRKIDENPVIKCEFCDLNCNITGKVWIRKIEDFEFIKKCKENLAEVNWLRTENKIKKLLTLLKNESAPFYYDIHKICQKHRLKIPKLEKLIDSLRKREYSAERTHFSYKGIKTDAELDILISSIKKLTEK